MVKQEKEDKNHISCSETTLSVEIPEDLVQEILHRIPAKCLVRWKAVSQRWKLLIEYGHYLAEKHLRHRQKLYGAEESKITFEGSDERGFHTKVLTKYDPLEDNKKESESEVLTRVHGSCNGLLCVYDLIYVNIFNPTTSVVRSIVPPHGTKLSLGFGRDVVTGAYKVVVAYSFDDDRGEEIIRVFDLSTSKWRRRYETAGPVPLSFTLVNPKRNAVFVKGSLFWLPTPDHSEILAMDLHTEKFRTVSQPKDIDVSSNFIYMWSRDDRLCVSDLTKKEDADVWTLVDELTDKWERSRFVFVDTLVPTLIPPYNLDSAWFSRTLVSPYQSSARQNLLR